MSIINRHNYEEYFLLYIDDELSAAERHAVEEFVNMHPDLKVELEMLQQSTLQADHIVFHDKDLLLKTNTLMVNESNYEEYFVLYADDELNNEQKDNVEQFVYRNSKYQAEFELIQKAKLEPDRHLVFPDKSLLYRSEKEDEKVFVLHWWKIAAAAIIFMFLSGIGWYIVSKEKTSLAIVKNNPQKRTEKHEPVKRQETESLVNIRPAPREGVEPKTSNQVAIKTDNTISRGLKKDKQAPAEMLTDRQVRERSVEGRNIQLASNVTTKRPEVSIASIGKVNSVALENSKKITDEAVGPIEPNEFAYSASDNEIEILNTSVNKKARLRGLFRKVSRVVEKTTNIDPSDVKGIRIANFEIAVK